MAPPDVQHFEALAQGTHRSQRPRLASVISRLAPTPVSRKRDELLRYLVVRLVDSSETSPRARRILILYANALRHILVGIYDDGYGTDFGIGLVELAEVLSRASGTIGESNVHDALSPVDDLRWHGLVQEVLGARPFDSLTRRLEKGPAPEPTDKRPDDASRVSPSTSIEPRQRAELAPTSIPWLWILLAVVLAALGLLARVVFHLL